MKKNIHPDYRDILFIDSATGFKFVCGSTLQTDKTETFEGKEYPAFYASVSSASHPFFTGSNKFVDSEGRVDKFLKRYAAATKKRDESSEEQTAEDDKKSAAAKVVKKKKKS